MQDKRIDALMVETKAGRQAVRAGIFIDCSGDGDLAAWAGAPLRSATTPAACCSVDDASS